ncbi:MAG: hypothetical protein HC827_02505 [Cyanobacteria bacterium RM1_2_2]|nr:hypothetical protein [Cyanobacteria bacterium RM1_2_2]
MNSPKTLELAANGASPDFAQGSIFFVGTATVIIRYAGFTILTDPNFLHQGDHIHLGYGLQATWCTNPDIEIESLPPLNLLVLSHMHDDHFDHIAAEKLDKTLPIVTMPHAAHSLQGKGFTKTLALKPWETSEIVRALQIIAPKTAIPIHYNDYTVFKSPLEDFIQAVKEAGLTEQVRYLSHGETYHFTIPVHKLD